ncbi:MAG: TlyA family RNA methyltransferase [Proteobacteria bacterium]|nr:TlyA family RNA methyltransferase [Pseudomonadota bacterium]
MSKPRPSAKERLDKLLEKRGLAPSRARAQALIMAGQVQVEGVGRPKPGSLVPVDVRIELKQPDHPYVGRGGVKLAGALDALGLDVTGLTCLDVGASTGGFTDCLLQRGAARVWSVDVGRGQLDWKLRQDPRVVVVEKYNFRHAVPHDFPEKFDLATVDVSFISLRLILPPLLPLLQKGGRVLALVKPQFEVGPDKVGKGGVVRDEAVRTGAVDEVAALARSIGLIEQGRADSPLKGPKGNQETFLRLQIIL